MHVLECGTKLKYTDKTQESKLHKEIQTQDVSTVKLICLQLVHCERVNFSPKYLDLIMQKDYYYGGSDNGWML